MYDIPLQELNINYCIYSFTHCKAVMKLTVSNGLSVHAFIS